MDVRAWRERGRRNGVIILDMVAAVVLLVLAAALATSTTVLLARANPDTHVPFLRMPQNRPWQYLALNFFMTLSGVWGTRELAHQVGLRPALLTGLAVLLLPIVVVTVIHNRHLRRA